MASNPQVSQGVLNRVRGSVQISSNSNLNVTASFLGRAGISARPESRATTTIPAMTGVVQSPEPYQQYTIEIHLLKSQPLSSVWKSQLENSTLIGDIIVRPDSAALSSYQYTNCAIADTAPAPFAGEDADFVVTLTGTYNINSSLFDLTT